MKRIRMIHWKPEEAEPQAEALRKAGFRIDLEPFTPAVLKKIREEPPEAVLVDLSRLPMQGRDVGIQIRVNGRTRSIPLVFAGGDPEKVEKVRIQLPDAVYTSWDSVLSALSEAIAHPPADPVKPGSALAGYAGTPLVRKLGIRADMAVCLIHAPSSFEQKFEGLPEGVRFRDQPGNPSDLIIWFCQSLDEMKGMFPDILPSIGRKGIWIVWPKKRSGIQTDLTQNEVRKFGLSNGLVDFKICALDETWSGLKFVRREE